MTAKAKTQREQEQQPEATSGTRAAIPGVLELPSQSQYLDYSDDEGLDPARYADPNCPRHCVKGILTAPDGGALPSQTLCPCVLEGTRRHACEVQIVRLFGKGGARMTFARYHAGDDQENQAALDGCLNYVDEFPKLMDAGAGFALWGEPGAGKTHLATATLIALIKKYTTHTRQLRVHHLSVSEMMNLRRKRIDDKTLEDPITQAQEADICLLDDLGTEYHVNTAADGLSFAQEQLYLILNHRLKHSLPTLYTTNLSRRELHGSEKEPGLLDARISRRLEERTLATWKVNKTPDSGKPPEGLAKLLTKPRR
jgi:DNA replication protein DnaC